MAIDFKVGQDQKAKKGFYSGCAALGVTEHFVVHSGDTPLLDQPVHQLDLNSAIERIAAITRAG